jgi:hypothetical protein
MRLLLTSKLVLNQPAAAVGFRLTSHPVASDRLAMRMSEVLPIAPSTEFTGGGNCPLLLLSLLVLALQSVGNSCCLLYICRAPDTATGCRFNALRRSNNGNTSTMMPCAQHTNDRTAHICPLDAHCKQRDILALDLNCQHAVVLCVESISTPKLTLYIAYDAAAARAAAAARPTAR